MTLPPTTDLLVRPYEFGDRVLRSHKLVVAYFRHPDASPSEQEFVAPRSTSTAAIRAVARCWADGHLPGVRVLRVELGPPTYGTVTS